MVERSRPYDPGVLDFRAGVAALREHLVALRESLSDSEAEALDGYIGYADALGTVNSWAAGNRH
jgi:hypothetical protein